MKFRRPASLALLLPVVCCGALRVTAQTPSALTQDERQKLKTAQVAALKDPAVQAAKAKNDPDALQKEIRAAMVQRDPSVKSLLEKADASRSQTTAATSNNNDGGDDQEKRGPYSYLTLGEKGQLRRAHSAAGKDPAVVAARQQLDGASTPQAKEKAEKALNDATGDAMLRADPTVKPLLEKVRQHQQTEDRE